MKFGDTILIEANGKGKTKDGQSVFGAIEQKVASSPPTNDAWKVLVMLIIE